jgi:hypothetical protein
MVMPGMPMGKWVAGKRQNERNYEAMDRGLFHGVPFYGALVGMSTKDDEDLMKIIITFGQERGAV